MSRLPPELHNNLAETRKAFGLTQDELARAVKVSRQTVSSIEQGDYNPSASLAMRLAELFDLTVEDLFSLPPCAKTELATERRRILKKAKERL